MALAPLHWAETVYDVRPSGIERLPLCLDRDERVGAPLPEVKLPERGSVLLGIFMAAAAWGVVASNDVVAERLVQVARTLVETTVAAGRSISARFDVETTRTTSDTAAIGNPVMAASPNDLAGAVPAFLVVTPTPSDTLVIDDASETVGETYAEPAGAVDEPTDQPEQRKLAKDAGLSPDLPNVLLSRLSKTDFAHAAYAIKTALAKTKDDGTFSWPAKPSYNEALFEVRFVAGAAPGCRRYIVTVTKARWSSTTTALENCNARASAG